VVCQASQDAVRTLFGPQFQPTTFGPFCHFLSPDNTDVQIAFSSGFVPAQYFTLANEHRASVTVAGHPGITANNEYDVMGVHEFDLMVSPGHDVSQPGYVWVNVTVRQARGDQAMTHSPKIDVSPAKLLAPLAEALLNSYFTVTHP
jgi:hypothetical protein